jgi:hypothetical protein
MSVSAGGPDRSGMTCDHQSIHFRWGESSVASIDGVHRNAARDREHGFCHPCVRIAHAISRPPT